MRRGSRTTFALELTYKRLFSLDKTPARRGKSFDPTSSRRSQDTSPIRRSSSGFLEEANTFLPLGLLNASWDVCRETSRSMELLFIRPEKKKLAIIDQLSYLIKEIIREWAFEGLTNPSASCALKSLISHLVWGFELMVSVKYTSTSSQESHLMDNISEPVPHRSSIL